MADELTEFIEKSSEVKRLHEAANEKDRQMRATASMPNCGYCRDCKWYNAPNPMANGDGICDNAFRKDVSLVALCGGDNCLYTKPNFGCVQFEAKC